MRLAKVAVLVPDYDEAIEHYTTVLGFEVLEDTVLSPTKRWVVVGPRDLLGAALVLAKADGERQAAAVGDQSGGRVFLFLETDDTWRDIANMRELGVVFEEEPRAEDYGLVAVFRDPFGNRWDLVQPVATGETASAAELRAEFQLDK